MKIIAAEDDPVALAILEASLQSLGYDVVTARNGEAAWSAFQSGGCRVLVCDWYMPGLDGLDLCRRIRSRPGEYVYFILLSNAKATNENRDLARAAGVDDFLGKPVDLQELSTRLHVANRILQYTTHIDRLESLIPICSYCKNVRDDQSYWQRIESYLAEKTGANCSHSVCPDCYDKFIIPQLKELGLTPKPYAGLARTAAQTAGPPAG